MFSNKKRNLILIIALVVILLLGAMITYFAKKPTVQLPESISSSTIVLTSNQEPAVGETFTVTVPGGKLAKSVQILIDGKIKKTCEDTLDLCQYTTEPFANKDLGTHDYSVAFLGEDAGRAQEGTFKVVKASTAEEVDVVVEIESAPEADVADTDDKDADTKTDTAVTPLSYDKIVTSGNKLKVGDLFTATIYVKDSFELEKIEYFIDGYKFITCKNANVCGKTVGPMNNGDIGDHTYEFRVVATDGQIIKTKSTYAVSALPSGQDEPPKSDPVPAVDPEPADDPGEDDPEPEVPPTLDISVSDDTIGVADTITVVADVTANDYELDYMNVYINSQVVEVCYADCTVTDGPFSEYLGKNINYQAIAYFTNGANLNTGLKYVAVEGNPDPSVTIQLSGGVIAADEKLTVTVGTYFGNKTYDRSDVYVGKVYKDTCNASPCDVEVGPFPEKAGSQVGVFAVSYFTDGTSVGSSTNMVYVEQPEPSLTLYLAPEKRDLDSQDVVTITSTATTYDKNVTAHKIYVDGYERKNCLGNAVCVLTDKVINIVGSPPLYDMVMEYRSVVDLDDGTTLAQQWTNAVNGDLGSGEVE